MAVNKVVFIICAATGIGLEIAIQFAKNGDSDHRAMSILKNLKILNPRY